MTALHALALRLFYRYPLDSCVEIEPRSAVFGSQAPGLTHPAPAIGLEPMAPQWLALETGNDSFRFRASAEAARNKKAGRPPSTRN